MISGNPRHDQRTGAFRGQASLEMTIALIGVLLLLFGSVKLFVWVNKRMVDRQHAYESSRVAAGQWNEPTQKLDIFGQ